MKKLLIICLILSACQKHSEDTDCGRLFYVSERYMLNGQPYIKDGRHWIVKEDLGIKCYADLHSYDTVRGTRTWDYKCPSPVLTDTDPSNDKDSAFRYEKWYYEH